MCESDFKEMGSYMAGRVTLIIGSDEHTVTRANGSAIVGQTVGAVAGDSAIKSIMGLDGRETVEVRSNGGSWNTQSNSYTLRDGDEVRFGRASGEKGVTV